MPDPLPELQAFLDAKDLVGIVVARSSGEELARCGDFRRLAWGHLVPIYFGDPDRVRASWAWLEGQLLPQNAAQGGDRCVISRIEAGILYGVFHVRALEPTEILPFASEIASDLEPLIERLFVAGDAPS